MALVTLVVGSFAIYLYRKQKKDEKARAARTILLEIRNAEKQLKDARARIESAAKAGLQDLPERLYAMPTRSWFQNRHLFAKDFTSDAWDAINEFYDKCEMFDDAIKYNDKRFSKEEQKVRNDMHKATYDIAKKYNERIADPDTSEDDRETLTAAFLHERESLISLLTHPNMVWVYTPAKQFNDVQNCLQNINIDLSLSAVGTKLERLSNGKD